MGEQIRNSIQIRINGKVKLNRGLRGFHGWKESTTGCESDRSSSVTSAQSAVEFLPKTAVRDPRSGGLKTAANPNYRREEMIETKLSRLSYPECHPELRRQRGTSRPPCMLLKDRHANPKMASNRSRERLNNLRSLAVFAARDDPRSYYASLPSM